MININSNDWFNEITSRNKLSPSECFLLNVGEYYSDLSSKKNYTFIKGRLEMFFYDDRGVEPLELKTRSRKRELLEPRQMIMHCLLRNTDGSSTKIGHDYSRDHATALHAAKVVDNLIETDAKLRDDYIRMLRYINLNSKADAIRGKYK